MKRTRPLVIFSLIILFIIGFLVNSNMAKPKGNIAKLREHHQYFLDNSPFKESLKFTKAERKAKGLPPNKYMERQWELTMDPRTGRPQPERLFKLQEELRKKALFEKVPGESPSQSWEERGPNNVGGRTRALMFDPNDGANDYKRVFAGGVSGGLWVNNDITDENSSWTEVNIPQNLAISVITYDPNNTNIFYVGTGESYVQGSVNGNGVWKSTDGGVNWARVFGGVTGETTFRFNAKVTVNSPMIISGDYGALEAGFGAGLGMSFSGNLVLVDDPKACNALVNASQINGNIAVIRRGSCNFTIKVKFAQQVGAIAVLVVNNVNGPPITMSGEDSSITIPSVMISKKDGEAIITELTNGTVNIEVQRVTSSFTGLFITPGVQHINDILIRNNNGVSEVYVAASPSMYTDSNPFSYLGIEEFGLYKSINAGNTWDKINLPTSAVGNDLVPNDLELGFDNKIWLATTRSILTFDGGGNILSSIDGDIFTIKKTIANARRTEIATSFQTADVVYVLANSSGFNGVELLKTTDGFSTSTNLTLPDDKDDGIPANDFTRGQAWYDLMLEVDPTNDGIVYAGGIDLFRSNNSGLAWTQISKWSNNSRLDILNVPFVHADQHALVFRNNNVNQAVIGNDGGVYYANSLSGAISNSSAINARNKNYNTLQFYYGAIGQEVGSEKLLAGAQDNGTQLINNASTGINGSNEVTGGDGAYAFIDRDNGYMISSYVYNNYYYLDYNTGGYKYKISDKDTGSFINPATLDSENNILYTDGSISGGINQIYRYVLGSNSSTIDSLSNFIILDGFPTAFKSSTYQTTTLFVGTDNGKLIKLENANSTPIWTDLTGANFFGSISCVELGETENDIFVTFFNYGVTSVFYTSDGGTTWLNKEGDLPDLPVTAIMMNPLDADEVIIGTDLGVWATPNFNDANPNWYQSQNGMKDVKVTSFDLRISDNTVLASTYGRGMFTGQFTAIKSTLSIDEFTQNDLITVYPTVSNGNIKISAKRDVFEGNIAVFDLNGRQVYKSKLNFYTNKVQNIRLRVSSGLYIVKFSNENLTSTHKIIIE